MLYLTKFQVFLLKYLFKKIIVQGFHHQDKITEIYHLVHEASQNEFNEDSKPVLDGFLTECFEDSLK